MEVEFLGRFCYHKLTDGDLTTPLMLIFNTIDCSCLVKRNGAGGVEGTATFRALNAVFNPVNDDCNKASTTIKFARATTISRSLISQSEILHVTVREYLQFVLAIPFFL